MTAGLVTDADERFMLGARNGIVTPTTEPISDTATTPFGLTLRAAPAPRNVVRLRSVNGVIRMDEEVKTDKVTTYETDGNEEASDTYTDYITD